MRKKSFILLFTIVFISAFAACSQSPANPSPVQPAETESTSSTEAQPSEAESTPSTKTQFITEEGSPSTEIQTDETEDSLSPETQPAAQETEENATDISDYPEEDAGIVEYESPGSYFDISGNKRRSFYSR